jgi:hypothetical protein
MLDPGSYRQHTPQRRENWSFLLIVGSVIFTTVFIVIIAIDLHWF